MSEDTRSGGRTAGSFSGVLATLVLGSLFVAGADWSTHLVLGARGGLVSPTAGALMSLIQLTVTAAMFVGVPVGLVVLLATRVGSASSDEWLDRILGPGGDSRWGLLGVYTAVGSLWGLGLFLIDLLGTQVLVLRILKAMALAAAWLIAFAGYRVIVRLRPSVAVWRPGLLLGVFGSAFYSMKVHGEFGAPHHLHLVYPVLLVTAAMALASSGRRPRPALRRGVIGAALVVSVMSLLGYDTHTARHSEAVSRTLTAYPAMRMVHLLTDLDADGYSTLLGGLDCDGLDAGRHPEAAEQPGNGRDDNCVGGDFGMHESSGVRWSVPARSPHIILVSIDALRADYVGRVVKGKALTPRLDELADAAHVFRRAYSPSTATHESLLATFSGSFDPTALRDGPTLASYLRHYGWRTVALTTLPWADPRYFDGFDEVDNALGGEVETGSTLISGDDLSRKAIALLDAQDPDQPLFLWLHYYDPHGPRTPLARLNEDYGSDPYVHEVHLTDIVIGRVFDRLRELGMWDDSVVVVFADHGEGLGEHGIDTHRWGGWESIVRVPLIVKLPGEPTGDTAQPVSTVGIVPTLTHFLSGDSSPGSLLPAIRGEKIAADVWYRTDWNGPLLFGTVQGRYNAWWDWRRNAFHVHDVVEDPDETQELAGTPQTEPLADELWRRWDRWRVARPDQSGDATP